MDQQCVLNAASVLGINYFTPTAQHDIWPSYKFHLAVPTNPQDVHSTDWEYADWHTALGSLNTWNRWVVEVEVNPSSRVRTKHVIHTDYNYANRISSSFWLRMQNAIQIPIEHEISNPRYGDKPESINIWLVEMVSDPDNVGECKHGKRYKLVGLTSASDSTCSCTPTHKVQLQERYSSGYPKTMETFNPCWKTFVGKRRTFSGAFDSCAKVMDPSNPWELTPRDSLGIIVELVEDS